MTGSLENIQRRTKSAGELALVVRTMKAMAISNMTSFEMAVEALQDYYRSISLGMYVSLRDQITSETVMHDQAGPVRHVAIVFGSDQGLVGPFNDTISLFSKKTLKAVPGRMESWAIGERTFFRLSEAELFPTKLFTVPTSVSGITPLVNHILTHIEEFRKSPNSGSIFVFHNSPLTGETYQPKSRRLFPIDEQWEQEVRQLRWPTRNLPETIGHPKETLRTLVREYLFVSLYKACAESLASENASRLAAMTRAEKNIEEMLEVLQQNYNRMRQSMIDEELFDVVAGFEALKKKG